MLAELIQQIENWENESPVDLFAVLTEPRMIPKPDDEAIWSLAGISRLYKVATGEAIYQGLIAAGMHGTAQRFASNGLDARNDQWLDFADQLIAGVDSLRPIGDQLKYIGFDRRSIWETASDEPLTVDLVEEAQKTLVASEFAIQLTQRVAAVISLEADKPGSTVESIREAARSECEA